VIVAIDFLILALISSVLIVESPVARWLCISHWSGTPVYRGDGKGFSRNSMSGRGILLGLGSWVFGFWSLPIVEIANKDQSTKTKDQWLKVFTDCRGRQQRPKHKDQRPMAQGLYRLSRSPTKTKDQWLKWRGASPGVVRSAPFRRGS
jgi:hypothetical protein